MSWFCKRAHTANRCEWPSRYRRGHSNPLLRALVPGALLLLGASALNAQTSASPRHAAKPHDLPLWAYPVAPAGAPDPRATAAHNQTPHHVPGSSQTYTTAQIANLFTVPDWFPNDHPPMPGPVRQGHKPDDYACAYCHLPNGLGRPENESIAGLPKAYIIEQVRDFKDGARHSSQPRMDSVNHMILMAKAATPEDVEQAADYFSKLKLTPWVRVIETNTVPKTHVAGGMLVPDAQGTEPIGSRIIEVPISFEQAELRNSHSGFIAYVPKGSVEKGAQLVKTGGNGATIACIICHGPDLHGLGNVPSIAGRSPSEMARQLMDFRDGARNGPGGALMKMPVAKLTDADIVAITAYLASLKP